MDYLEGFLIGPIWSDTEYQTRTHKMLYLLLATAVGALYVFLLFMPAWRPRLLVIPFAAGLAALILLVLLTPFLSCFYYRVPIYLRPLLLLIYVAKYVFAVSTLLHLVLPLFQPDLAQLSAYFIHSINERINLATAWFDALGPLFGMIAGIIVGGLWSVGEVLLVAAVVIVVPLLVLLLLRGLRYVMDRLIASLFFSTQPRR